MKNFLTTFGTIAATSFTDKIAATHAGGAPLGFTVAGSGAVGGHETHDVLSGKREAKTAGTIETSVHG